MANYILTPDDEEYIKNVVFSSKKGKNIKPFPFATITLCKSSKELPDPAIQGDICLLI